MYWVDIVYIPIDGSRKRIKTEPFHYSKVRFEIYSGFVGFAGNGFRFQRFVEPQILVQKTLRGYPKEQNLVFALLVPTLFLLL